MKRFYLPKPTLSRSLYLAFTDLLIVLGCAGALAALWYWLFCVRC